MSAPANLINKRFGRLLVTEKLSKRGRYGEVYWKCICDCGNIKMISGNSLRQNSKSCGCLQKEIMRKICRKAKGESGFNVVKGKYKYKAKKKNHDFNLNDEELKILFKGNCYYCGIIPENIWHISDYLSEESKEYSSYVCNGIDRIDSNKGYIIDNCVSCCTRCNFAKNNMSQEVFKNHIKKIFYYWANK